MASTPMLDNASGIQAVVQYVATDLKLPQHPAAASAAAYNSFVDAVMANAAGDPKKTEAALRATIKADPNFPPTAFFAMHYPALINSVSAADIQAFARTYLDAAKAVRVVMRPGKAAE